VVDIYLEYQGDLHCQVKHGPSSALLSTDAPVDNHGRGESFSPTDLLAAGLGSCIVTVMGIQAQKHGYSLEGTRVHVKKTMTTGKPRRIAQLAVQITLPKAATVSVAGARAGLEQEAHQCPVRLSLLEAIDIPVQFDWESD
jgi:putative redox protein